MDSTLAFTWAHCLPRRISKHHSQDHTGNGPSSFKTNCNGFHSSEIYYIATLLSNYILTLPLFFTWIITLNCHPFHYCSNKVILFSLEGSNGQHLLSKLASFSLLNGRHTPQVNCSTPSLTSTRVKVLSNETTCTMTTYNNQVVDTWDTWSPEVMSMGTHKNFAIPSFHSTNSSYLSTRWG